MQKSTTATTDECVPDPTQILVRLVYCKSSRRRNHWPTGPRSAKASSSAEKINADGRRGGVLLFLSARERRHATATTIWITNLPTWKNAHFRFQNCSSGVGWLVERRRKIHFSDFNPHLDLSSAQIGCHWWRIRQDDESNSMTKLKVLRCRAC